MIKKTIQKLVGFAVAILPLALIAQTQTENYVVSKTYKVSSSTKLTTTDPNSVLWSIQYFDGLGRAKQSVGYKLSPNQKDIITHYEYDAFGRAIKTYLPYASTQNTGAIVSNALTGTNNYYTTHYGSDMNLSSPNPFSEQGLEVSPLNRVLEQAAPGEDWKIGTSYVANKDYSNGHTIKMEYLANAANEVRRYYVTTNFTNNTYEPTLQGGTSDYPVGELTKMVTKDENWTTSDGVNKTTEEFKNLQGQVILKRTYNAGAAHDTYYVYDNFGNLTYVLPPKSEADANKPNTTELNELCYQYKYDYRNRLVEKKIPGKGWEYIVYNRLDQPILTQDANLRSNDEWLFTKYDALGRVAFTGLWSDTQSHHTIQGHANNPFYTNVVERKSTISYYGGVGVYYTNTSLPQSNIQKTYTINYYDTYVDLPTGFTAPTSVYGESVTTNTKGLATVTKTRVLETNDWITTLTYYDEKARPIYVYSKNDYLDTEDIVESKLDFTGKVLETKTTHKKTGKADIVTIDRFEYDHQDRLIAQTQKVNNQISERIVKNNYDELGQLESKLTGNGTQAGYTNITSGINVLDDIITCAGNGWNIGLTTIGDFQADGYVEFSPMQNGKYFMAGLSDNNTTASYQDIDYAIYIHGTAIYIYESGTSRGNKGSYLANDVFKVERIGNKIYYKKNGETFYTSTVTSTSTLFGDISMYHNGGKIKNLHIVDNSKGLQNVDYNYNVRGWLTNINQDTQSDNDLFNFTLRYNNPTSGTALYNGNIAQTSWNTLNTDSSTKTYTYTYDALNRITNGLLSSSSSNHTNKHNLKLVEYDKNGNITKLRRNGYKNNGVFDEYLDHMTYYYNGNQLTGILEEGHHYEGFADKTHTSTSDYTYDVNGNMLTDQNKGITDIDYNHLNLPTQVTINGSTINYTYDATGVKQRKVVGSTTTDYAGNHIYENGNLQFFNHAEGYVKKDGNDFEYVYQYKDHLGNVRLSYADPDGTYQNILDDDFSTSFGNWIQNGSTNPTLENGRVKVNVNSSWEGLRNEMVGVEVSPGEIYTIKIKFDKGNTQSAVRLYIQDFNASGAHIRWSMINANMQTGSHVYTYTVGSNTKSIYLRLDKDNTNTSTETQFYVDYITFSRGNLEIIEESNYYPFGLKHKGYNNVTTSNGNSVAQKWGYQGQEIVDDLGLNVYEWKYRVSDPATGRFWQIDPLAEEYSYNSTYAFQENKLGLGTELEGLEVNILPPMYPANVTAEHINRHREAQRVEGTVASAGMLAMFGATAAAMAGVRATVAFVANEVKDEILSQATGGASDVLDATKMAKNFFEKGIKTLSKKGTKTLSTDDIKFSQKNVNGSEELVESMKKNGWQGDPIDVVDMGDGLTTIDNTRVLAAHEAGIDVQAIVHKADELLPKSMAKRFKHPKKKGVYAKTWGEAAKYRIQNQGAAYRNANPNGSQQINGN